MTPAERQRRYRTRRSLGRMVLKIEVDDVDLPELLMAEGWLKERDQSDPAAIAASLERMVAWLSRPAANDV